MKNYLRYILFFFVFISTLHAHSSFAELRIVTDIAPVHGLAKKVMEGVGSPSLIIRPGSDPHYYNLRPSEAANIEKAHVIFWIGPELTPWLASALDNLAEDAKHISLLDAKGVHLITGGHHHGHDDHKEHDDHAKKSEPVDPHAWLDPENAIAWLAVIADEAAHHDPANEARYRENAKRAAQAISEQQARISKILASEEMPAIFAQHDAYRYFEARFDFELAGALYDTENEPPSPAHISELHALTKKMDKACLLAETDIENNVVASVFENTALYIIDANPSGLVRSSNDNGYFGLFDALEAGFEGCAKP